MIIKANIAFNAWLWSSEEDFGIPTLQIKLSNRLSASAEFVSDLETVNDPRLPSYKSYRNVKTVSYIIKSTKADRYPEDIRHETLTLRLGEDITKVHNRMVEVIRGKLSAWQISPITAIEDFKFILPAWETYYRRGERGPYKRYSNGLKGLESILGSYSRGLGLSKMAHLEYSDLDEVSEWLEGNLPITVTEELSTQAVEAENNKNLRLAIFNYVIALEQTLQQYLLKQFNAKLADNVDPQDIDYFLRSDQTNAKDKLNILLRLVIHDSWLKDIDFKKVETAIEARNKIAHGDTIHVIDRYSSVDWRSVFKNVEALIKSLTDAILLIEHDPELKEITEEFHQKYDSYPSIWVHRRHRMTCEVTLFFGDIRTAERLAEMATTLATKRSSQDNLFDRERHLTVNFVEFPDNKFATWKAGKLNILAKQ